MLTHYILLSLKILLRRPFFTAVSIFGISFTLLVLMVATAMLDHTFGPGAPELKHDRLLTLADVRLRGPRARSNSRPGYRLLDRYARHLPGAEATTFFSEGYAVTYIDGRKAGLSTKGTDGDFWRVYDFTFLEGTPYTAADLEQGRQVAVINRHTRDQFFSDGPVLGRTFTLDGDTFRIVGVVDDVSMLRFEPFSDVWVPYTAERSTGYRAQTLMGNFKAVALARDRAARTTVRDEFNSRMTRVDRGDLGDDYAEIVAPFETPFERLARNSPFGDPMNPAPQGGRLLAFLVLLALLFATLPIVNLVNLNVSRVLERSSEIGVRKAFGASKRALVGQFLVENVLLTLVSAALGLVLSVVVLNAINSSGLVPYAHFTINLRVFGYSLVTALAFGFLSGVYPAWRMARLHPVDALKGGAR